MAKFELELELKYFEKLVSMPKILDKVVSKWDKVSMQQKMLAKSTDQVVKKMQELGYSAERIWLTQKKMQLEGFLAKAGDKAFLLTKGLQLAGTAVLSLGKYITGALIGTGIGLVIGALVLLGTTFKKLFAFNVGGIATAFYKISATIKLALNSALIQTVELFKKLAPVIKPIIEFFTTTIISAIRGVGALFGQFTKSAGTISSFAKYFELIGKSIKVMFSLIGQLFKGISAGFSGAQGGSGNFLESLFSILNVVVEIETAIMEVIKQLHLFEIIGTVLGVTFRIVVEVFKILSTIIKGIVQGITDIVTAVSNVLKGDFKGAGEALARNVGKTAGASAGGSKSVTQTVSIHSAGPITEDSAERIGEIMKNKLSDYTLTG